MRQAMFRVRTISSTVAAKKCNKSRPCISRTGGFCKSLFFDRFKLLSILQGSYTKGFFKQCKKVIFVFVSNRL